jgi:hypothetical protein
MPDEQAGATGTSTRGDQRQVIIHLTGQATVAFTAEQMWPLHGDYGRFGPDLEAFAGEITRRLRADGYVGYRFDADRITVIPVGSIKRIDFSHTS